MITSCWVKIYKNLEFLLENVSNKALISFPILTIFLEISSMMPMSEPELDEWEGKIVTQIEFYFSDQNLPGDKFLCEQLRAAEATGHPNTIPLVVVASFRKVKKLLKGRCTPKGPHPVEVLATVLKKGSSALFVVGGQHESGDERGGGRGGGGPWK